MSTHAGAEPGRGKDVLPVTQADREEVVETLQHAAGDGRLPLNEFSERVSMALTAETRHQLEAARAGLKPAPPVESAPAASSIVTFFGHRRQAGRWRLPSALRARALFGDLYLDLREVTVHDDVVDISATTLFGNLTIDVPEGIEVELTGFDVFGDRELRLAPVPGGRVPPLFEYEPTGCSVTCTCAHPQKESSHRAGGAGSGLVGGSTGARCGETPARRTSFESQAR